MSSWKDKATTGAIIAGIAGLPAAAVVSTVHAPDAADVQQNAQRIAALDAARYATTQPALQKLQEYLAGEEAARGLLGNERAFLLSQTRSTIGWLDKHESASARAPLNSIISFTDPQKEEVLRPGHPRPEAATVNKLATAARDALANDVASRSQAASVTSRTGDSPQR